MLGMSDVAEGLAGMRTEKRLLGLTITSLMTLEGRWCYFCRGRMQKADCSRLRSE